MNFFRSISNRLSDNLRNELKRWYYKYLIKRGKFDSDEPEFTYIEESLSPGDCVIDIGANIGTYTSKFSRLVGSTGRVIAFEPVPQTFNILASNSQLFTYPNVTLINAAASDCSGIVRMNIPLFNSGQRNYYQASIVDGEKSDAVLEILCVTVDSLDLTRKIKLAKIDAEGHEYKVIMGMINLIKRDRPLLIIEGDSPEIEEVLYGVGYVFRQLPRSPNRLYYMSD